MSRTPAEAVRWVLDTDPASQPALGPNGWSQDCGRLMVRALDIPAQGDAIDALHLARIEGTDLYPPYGAIAWWDNGRGVGHVGVVIDAHGSVLMTDAPAADQFPGKTTAGITTVPRYLDKGNGFRYVGWSRTYGRAAINTTDAGAAGTIGTASAGRGGLVMATLDKDDLDAIKNAIEDRLRHAEWQIGPDRTPITLERALGDLTDRQIGYGRRTEDLHLNLMPAALDALARLAAAPPAAAASALRALSDADLDAIAGRVLDAQAERLRE